MVRTNKGSLSSSSGVWLLFLVVALFLLPSTFALKGYSCHLGSSTDTCITGSNYYDKYCVKRWESDGKVEARGCTSSYNFRSRYGFEADLGCGAVKNGKAAFACACPFEEKGSLCNDEAFGEDKYKEWKAKGGGSSALGLSNPFRLTFFAIAALLTIGAILGR